MNVALLPSHKLHPEQLNQFKLNVLAVSVSNL